MKKFQFQFETLEKVRRTRENEALRVLSEAQAAHARAIGYKRSLLEGLEKGLQRRELLGQTPTRIEAFLVEGDFITGQKARIVQADQSIMKAKRGVEKALRSYLQARRQTRMIEMLREKAFVEYKAKKAKYEQKQMDDLTIMRNRLRAPEQESA